MTFFKFFITVFLFLILTSASAVNHLIPFKTVGNLIIVKATVGDQTGNFILDTGIPNVVLNSKFFKGKISEKIFHGINGQVENLETIYTSVEIGKYKWKNIFAEVISIQNIEITMEMPIHGLIGTSIFRKHLLLIDFQKLNIEMYPINKNEDNAAIISNEPPLETLSFKIKGGAPLVSFFVDNQELKVTIDTGAEINLFENKHLGKLSPHMIQPKNGEIGGFGKHTSRTIIWKISGLKTGSLYLKEMNTAFTDLSHFNRNVGGLEADGIVGQEFLSQFKVAFDFKNKEMHLWKPTKTLMAEND